MKIVLICHEYPPEPFGGIGRFSQTYAEAMVKRGHEVTVVGTSEKRRFTVQNDVLLKLYRRIPNTMHLLNLPAIWRTIRQITPDFLETPDFQGSLPLGSFGIPCAVRLHNTRTALCTLNKQPIDVITRWKESQTLRKNPNWIAISKFSLELTQQTFGCSPEKSALIPNPVLPMIASGDDALDFPYILFPGTVRESKGAIFISRVANDILKTNASLHIVFAGSEVFENGSSSFEQVLSGFDKTTQTRVHLKGRVNAQHLAALMAKATVIVCPSYQETFGLVAAEALSTGRPTLLSDIPSFREIAPGDLAPKLPHYHATWVDTIYDIIQTPAQHESQGQKARAYILSEFSVERCCTSSEQFMKEIIDAR